MKNFEIPELNVIRCEAVDVITTSNDPEVGGNDNIVTPDDEF